MQAYLYLIPVGIVAVALFAYAVKHVESLTVASPSPTRKENALLAGLLLVGVAAVYGRFFLGTAYFAYLDSGLDTIDQYVPFYLNLLDSIRDGSFGAWNFDFGLDPDGSVWVIEAAARCGATCIPELITLSCGVDFYECIIRNALGERVSFPDQSLRPSMAELLFSECGGVVQSIDEERLGRLRAQGVQVSLDVSVGDTVRSMRNGTDRYGQVIMATADRGRFSEVVAEVEGCVRIA